MATSIKLSSSVLLGAPSTRACFHIGGVISGLLCAALHVTVSRELSSSLLLNTAARAASHVGMTVTGAGHICFSLSLVSLATFLVLLLLFRNFTASAEEP